MASDRPTGGAYGWLKSAAWRATGSELRTRKSFIRLDFIEHKSERSVMPQDTGVGWNSSASARRDHADCVRSHPLIPVRVATISLLKYNIMKSASKVGPPLVNPCSPSCAKTRPSQHRRKNCASRNQAQTLERERVTRRPPTEAQTGSRARSGSRSERTLDAVRALPYPHGVVAVLDISSRWITD